MVAIRREGRTYIVGLAVCATLITAASYPYPLTGLKLAAVCNWILVLLVINFFRDPDRRIPADARAMVAPADGKVIDIRRVKEDSYLHAEVLRVSIFMSVFDVHVNRAPLDGRIDYVAYRSGQFVAAFRGNASEDNERLSIGFLGEQGGGGENGACKIMITLIAGFIARRIICFKELHEPVRRGERIGMIKFGSRVDVYMPDEWAVEVRQGQRVKAGETILARMKPA